MTVGLLLIKVGFSLIFVVLVCSQFMYTEELDEQQSDDKLCGLLKAGKRFEVKLLENRCEDLLYKRLNIQNMLNIYEVAELLNKQPLMECCFSLMIK